MTAYHATAKLHFPLHKPGFEDVTEAAKAAVAASGVTTGIITVYSQHTTCSVLIQEESMDQTLDGVELLLQDMVNYLTGLVPTCRHEGQYLHPGPIHIRNAVDLRDEHPSWGLNTDGHIISSILGRSDIVPVHDGSAVLGEFGRFYFGDLDSVRERTRAVFLTVMGQ